MKSCPRAETTPYIEYSRYVSKSLLPHQTKAVHFALERTGCLLHLKQGTGKTLIGLSIAARKGSGLFVVPAALCPSWKAEAAKWYQSFQLHQFKSGMSPKRKEEVLKEKFVVTSYEMFQKMSVRTLNKFGAIIFDECQHLKTRGSKKTEFAKKVIEECESPKIVLMSGTPFPNGIHEAYHLYDLLDVAGEIAWRKLFKSFTAFQKKFQKKVGDQLIRRPKQPAFTIPVYEGFINQEEYAEAVAPCTYHTEVNIELPEMLEVDVEVDAKVDKSVDAALRELAVEDGRNPDNFQTARRLSAISKCKVWADYLLSSGADHAVGLSGFPDAVKTCAELLVEGGASVAVITAETSGDKRGEIVADFQAGKYRFLIGSLEVMKEGFNLQRANLLVFNDVSPVPGVNEQAAKRIHRMGQTRDCRIVYLMRPGSDRRVTELFREKAKNLREIERVTRDGGSTG